MSTKLRFVLAAIVFAAVVLVPLILWVVLTQQEADETGKFDPNSRRNVAMGSQAGSLSAALRIGREPYASSAACQECHADEHAAWHDSYHRTMTQWASPEAVAAPFDVTLESRGHRIRLERRGDQFWVSTLGQAPDGSVNGRGLNPIAYGSSPAQAQRVVLTTGSHIAQTYWVETPDGLQHVPWMYHIEQRQWIPNDDSFLVPPVDQRTPSQWHSNCVKCHTSAPMPGYNLDRFQTSVAELGIACEACHGPGEAHSRFHKIAPGERASLGEEDAVADPIINPAQLSHDRSSHVCGQCHSSHRENDLRDWLASGSRYLPGNNLEKFVSLHRYGTGETAQDYGTGHWGDGTTRTGGDELLGMIQSKCYQQGDLSCLSCHSMHDYASNTDQLKASRSGNESCYQCHDNMRDRLEEHTHHSDASSGSRCANCHMPHITYALFKGIRSHRIDSPSAAITAQTGRPNACNLCHLDQPLKWTADRLTQWYGQPEVELDHDQESISDAVIMSLRGDAAQRIIAAWHLGWQPATDVSGNDWQAAYLAYLLDDPYSVVRYVSYLSLKKMPGWGDFQYDFLAGPEERRQAKERALDQWREQGAGLSRSARATLLLDAQGRLKTDIAAELLRRRDRRYIVIAE